MRGRSAAEARTPFQRVLMLEPDHLAAMVHLARVAAIEGRRDEMLELVGRVLRTSPEADQALAMRALRAYAVGDAAGIQAVNTELRSARAITVASAFADVALYSGNLEGAEMLARGFIEVVRSPELRALCHIQLAHLALAQGNAGQAQEELRRAQALDQAWGLETRGLLATLPFAAPDAAELDRLRRDLAAWDAAAVPPSSFAIFAMHNDLHPTIREYLQGMVSLRLGDLAAARAHAGTLSAMVPRDGALGDCLASELDAALAREDGRTAEALAILDRARPRLWFQLTVASPFFCLTSRRFLQAELLREAGRTEEAAGWYGSLVQRSPYELVYRAVACDRLVQLG
ncbi:MAG TPA: hypothetical protein VHG35_05805 [Gemmatimonadales bacterium]|nr:hypothetical protein [Gemmatimonadales bacterium]